MSIDFGKYGEIISLKENDQTIPVSHTTLYALIKENITGPDKIYLQNGIDALVTALTDESVWGNFIWKNTYPTWCNVYAQYLSSYIYGQIDGDYRVSIKDGTMSANKLNDHFNNGKSSIHYKELPKSDEIWTKYINKGYPVYFLVLGDLKTNGFRCPGHIETGFPASTGINIWNGKIFGQENSLASILNVTSNKLVVGAGGTVGFKSYDEYKWLKSDQTRASLSFQYLNNVYDKKQ
jgi:hypothetical protein